MNIVNIETRLRKIEARRARTTATPLTKQQRDVFTASAAAVPGAETRALAALDTERNAMIHERNAAVIAAFWRADT